LEEEFSGRADFFAPAVLDFALREIKQGKQNLADF
jgi:hypothetical protein